MKFFATIFKALGLCACMLSSVLLSATAQETLPSVRMLSAPLVSPTNAWTYYLANDDDCPITGPGCAEPATYDPRIQRLAEALNNDPTLIYEYVKYNIDYTPLYGVLKGSYGTLMDGVGTSFDQAQLMVQLLRQAGYTASYEIGDATFSQVEIKAWLGTDNPIAVTKMLSDGGIPAVVSGGSADFATLLHIWVSVQIDGQTVYFDPSFKNYEWSSGLSSADITNSFGFNASTFISSSTSGGTSNFVKNMNHAAIESTLKTSAMGFVTELSKPEYFGKSATEILGGKKLPDFSVSQPHESSYSRATNSRATWTADIPDVFKAKFILSFENTSATTLATQLWTTDQIAGRRIGLIYNDELSPTLPAPDNLHLVLDEELVTTIPLNKAFDAWLTVNMTVDHPYAATKLGGSVDGAYLDSVEAFSLPTYVFSHIAHSWGPVSQKSVGEWEALELRSLDIFRSYFYATNSPQFVANEASLGGYGIRALVGRRFTALLQQAGDLHADIAGGSFQHHHSVGLTSSDMQIYHSNNQIASDDLRMSMSTAYSFNGFEALDAKKNDFAFAFTATASAVEASTFQQISGKPHAMSVVSMLTWLSETIASNGEYSDALDGFYLVQPGDTAGRDTAAAALNQLHVSLYNTDTTAQIEDLMKYGAYLDAGYSIIIPSRRFMGPAENAYQLLISPQPLFNQPDKSSKYPGTGFIAFDENNPTDYAYVMVTRQGRFKGAGSIDISQPNTSINVTGEYLDKQYSSIASSFDVDLNDGSLKIAPGADIVSGQGSFPYSLAFQRSYSSERDTGSFFTIFENDFIPPYRKMFDYSGWTHNYEIGLNVTTNATVAMGNSNDPRAAATAIATFAMLQEMASESSSLQRLLISAIVADWWTKELYQNSVQITGGGADTQFYRLANGSFVPQIGSAAELRQLVQPVLNRHEWDLSQFGYSIDGTGGYSNGGGFFGCNIPFEDDDNPNTTNKEECANAGGEWGFVRGGLISIEAGGGVIYIPDTRIITWDHLYKDVLFEYETEDGQVLSFSYKPLREPNYIGENPEQHNGSTGDASEPPKDTLNNGMFLIDSWTFPNTISVNFNYDTLIKNKLNSVSNSLGRSLTFGGGGVITADDGCTVVVSGSGVTKTVDGVSQTTYFSKGLIADNGATYLAQRVVLDVPGQNYIFYAKPMHIAEFHLPTDTAPSFTFSYDELGHVSAITNKDNVSSTYAIFDGAGSVTDPLGNTSTALYDHMGRAAKSFDPLGSVGLSSYDGLGRLIEGQSYAYDDMLSYTGRAEYAYDYRHNVVMTAQYPAEGSTLNLICQRSLYTGPVGQKTRETFAYESDSNLCLEPAGTPALDFAYYTSGNGNTQLQSWSGPLGTFEEYTYNTIGQPTLVSEKINTTETLVTSYGYNAQGSMSSVTLDPTGEAIKTEFLNYSSAGDPTQVKSPNGHTSDLVFDELRRLHTSIAPLAGGIRAEQKVIFDNDGRVTRVDALSGLDQNGAKLWASTHYSYYTNRRLESVTDPDGHITRTVYDAKGRAYLTIDAEDRKVYTVFDALDRPVKVIKAWQGAADGSWSLDPALKEACDVPGTLQQCYQHYTYTPNGQIETVQDAKGNTTTYGYDGFDRLSSTTFPDASVETYEYDANNNMWRKTTRSGEQIYFYYDALNRLLGRSVPNSAPAFSINVPGQGDVLVTHAFTYDLVGRMKTATHDGETISMDYDSAGRLIEKAHNGSNKVAYDYDAAGNVTRLIYPDGWGVDFQYDALNRVETAHESLGVPAGTSNTSGAGDLLASVSYDALSRRQNVTYGNGASQSYDFTARGDLTQIGYDFAGVDAPQVPQLHSVQADFVYNGVGQLLSQSISDTSLFWTHQGPDQLKTYAVNELNQYTGIDVAANQGAGFQPLLAMAPVHDLRGNLTADGKGRGFVYDAENVLRAVNDNVAADGTGGTLLAEYSYGADATRRTKTVHSTSTVSHFWYTGDQEIMETSASGATMRRYVRLPGAVDEAILMLDYSAGSAPTEVWAHMNRLGSTIMTSNDNGEITEKFTYSPYGVSGESTTGLPFRYTGQKLDPETGLYYYKARYYDPEEGRFLQTDPIGYADQMNLYGYVGNDPVNFFDPTGMKTVDCISVECNDPIRIADLDEGDIIETPGATVTVGENKAADVVIKEGYTAVEAADSGPIIIPVGPDGVSVDENIKTAIGKSIFWFRKTVPNKGPWDYKQQGSEFEAFGNFNYGATGRAVGFSDAILRQEAGKAQIAAGTSLDEWGKPGIRLMPWTGSGSFGDDPRDAYWIRQGSNYYNRRERQKREDADFSP